MRIDRRRVVLFTLILFAVAAVLFGVLRAPVEDGADDVEQGTALDVGAPFEVESPLQVGQEAIDMFASITNISSTAIELLEIRPLVDPTDEEGEVVGVFLAERPFEGGLFNTVPPVMMRNGRCVLAKVQAVRGYVLHPGDAVMVAVHVRALKPGTFRWEGRQITYLQGEGTYRQRDPYSFAGEVRHTWKRELSRPERRCAPETTLLPGS